MIGESTPAPLCVRVNVAARMIGLGRTKLYELIGNGEIEVIKVGKATLVTTASLNAMIERRRLVS
ncbi:MAG: helix-turn-helix domain-containing protein [Sphingomonadaceae bacterium]